MAPTLQLFTVAAGTSYILPRLTNYPLSLIPSTLLLFVVSYVAHLFWSIAIYPDYFSPLRDIPKAPDGEFFLGHLRTILREAAGRPQRRWIETVPNDGLIRYTNFFQERILITDPKALGEVLVTKNYDFVKPSGLREGISQILGVGILLAEGDEHKRQRKLLMPAFAYRHIKDLYPIFWAKSREMIHALSTAAKPTSPTIEKAEDGAVESPEEEGGGRSHAPGTLEVGSWTSRATLDIIGVSGCGQDFASLQNPDNKLNQTYRSLFNPGRGRRRLQFLGLLLPPWLIQRLPVKRNREVREGSAYVKSVCRELIAQKRKVMQEKERTDVDIISVALESGGFTDEDLVNQMMTFLVAGHETTATAMIWALYLLCKHPEVQTRLRREIREKLPSVDEEVTAVQVDECHYLSAVCSEVLRLWPPVALTLRVADKDTSISNHFIPKGTTIILAPAATNTSTSQWGPDALSFNPDRWMEADGRANNKGGAGSNFSFLTFLHGPRSCIGQKFALAEFACLLAAWVGRFETAFEEGSELAKDGEPEIKGGITGKPKGGLWVNLKEVEGW